MKMAFNNDAILIEVNVMVLPIRIPLVFNISDSHKFYSDPIVPNLDKKEGDANLRSDTALLN